MYLLISSLLTLRVFVMILTKFAVIEKPQAIIPVKNYKGRTKEGVNQQSFKGYTDTQISKYCEQNDIHSPHVTFLSDLIKTILGLFDL